jgi:adenylate cyclase
MTSMAPLLATPSSAADRPRRLTLRVTLQALLLGLLLATVLAVGAVDYVSSRQAVEDLELQLVRAGSQAVAKDVEASFAPSLRALQELQLRAEFGRLPLDDRLQLGLVLADRLRYEHAINRLLYADQATGGAVSAFRDMDGRIILGILDPALEGGQFLTWEVHPDGTRTPYPVMLPAFDARERTYYGPAANTTDLVWTGPEPAPDGIPVMNASIAVRESTTQSLLGVLLAQVFLDELPTTLRQALDSRPGAEGFLFTREGQLLATAHPASSDLLAPLDAALPTPIPALPLDTPIPVRFDAAGVEYAGAMQGFRVAGGLEWFTGFVLPEATLLQAVYDRQRMALLAAGVLLVIGVSLGALMAARIARPLHQIARDLTQVAQFHLSPAPAPRSFVQEVAVVADAVDRMKASLRSFARFVPGEVVRDVLVQGEDARLGGELRTLTILFSDIEGFTTLSERLTPTQVVEYLAEYFQLMTAAMHEQGGTVNQFLGDGTLVLFNAPSLVPGHAACACRAALRAQERLAAMRGQWAAAGRPPFRTRIGLHSGEVVVGTFGTPERFAYSAIGDAMNLASRLEGLNKSYGTYIVASEAVRAGTGTDFEWRRLDRVAVVGRHEGTDVYELLGETGAVPEEMRRAREAYESALAGYFARRFDEAAAGFHAAARLRPHDKAAEMMARRAEQLAIYQPPPTWDGVYVSSTK